MVEITEPTLVRRLIEMLGLRGRPIVSARNSVYPVVVGNTKSHPVAVTIPLLPPEGGVGNVKYITGHSGGTVGATIVLYTVPAGRRFHLMGANLNEATANYSMASIWSSAVAIKYVIVHAVSQFVQLASSQLVLTAGESIRLYESVAGNTGFYYTGWEEDA